MVDDVVDECYGSRLGEKDFVILKDCKICMLKTQNALHNTSKSVC